MIKVLKKLIQHKILTQFYPAKELDTRFFSGKPVIDSSKCNLCNECVRRCPVNAISALNDDQKLDIDYKSCIYCRLCEEVCENNAVIITKEFESASAKYEASGEQLKKKIHQMFGRSLQIREVDAGSCNGCDYEINALNNPFNDIERFGIHFVASPRHADMLLVTGTATRNMELALRKTYEATPNPKLVVAVGACACSGGIFKDLYATQNGIDEIVPVDVYIPGCPPRPQAIIDGILKALEKK